MFTSTMILAVMWSLWHWPLPFIKGTYQYDVAHTQPIYPGSSADLTVDLPAGRYTLKSDINDQVIAMNVPLFVLP